MKRFTEANKWRDAWFRQLPPPVKLAFLYLVDNCDSSGVWDNDFGMADFSIGQKIDWELVLRELGGRVQVMPNGKWWLTRFCEFQYGVLSVECRPHVGIIKVAQANGLKVENGIVTLGLPLANGNAHPIAIPTLPVRARKVVAAATPEEETVYAAYPHKIARADAVKAIRKALPVAGYERLLERTKAFAAAVALWPEHDKKYIPHPATWYNGGRYDDDPATWVKGRPQLQIDYSKI